MTDPIKVFVGCDPNDCDLEQMMVLEYSLRKHSSLPVDIHWMQLSRNPESFWFSKPETGEGWNTVKWATPFSAFRWSIPAHCNYEGRAIYMDADMLVMSDIAELWTQGFEPEKLVMVKGGREAWRFCVCMWDCAAAKEFLPGITEMRSNPDTHKVMKRFFQENQHQIQQFDTQFNNIDGEGAKASDIKILHYSDMGTQFSHAYSIPRLQREGKSHWFDGALLPHPRDDLRELFDTYYHEALAAGYSLDNYRNPSPFGRITKFSQKNYSGNGITRPKSLAHKLIALLRGRR